MRVFRVVACPRCRIKVVARYGGKRKPKCPQCHGEVVALRRDNMTKYADCVEKRREELMRHA